MNYKTKSVQLAYNFSQELYNNSKGQSLTIDGMPDSLNRTTYQALVLGRKVEAQKG